MSRQKIITTAFLLALPLFITACSLQDLPVVGKYFGGGGSVAIPVTLNVWGL